jgi:hypothetical protein
MVEKQFNYRRRVADGLDNIVAMCEAQIAKGNAAPFAKRVLRIARAQIGNLARAD